MYSLRDSERHEGEAPKLSPEIANKETQLILRLKLFVILVLIGSAIIAALLVFMYTRNSEVSNFENQFTEYAEKVMETIISTLETSFGAMDMLASSVTAYAENNNQTWPFVFVPDFAIRASKTMALSRSFQMYMAPLVSPEERVAWEEFAKQHQYEDMNDTLKTMEIDPNYYGPIDYNCTYRTVYGDYGDIPYNVTRDVLPNWLTYPNICGGWYAPHGWDFLSQFDSGKLYDALAGRVRISRTHMLPDPENPLVEAQNEAWAAWGELYIPPWEEGYEPMSEVHFPLFEKVPGGEGYDPEPRKVGGIFVSSFYWREMLKDILPQGADGVVIVTEVACCKYSQERTKSEVTCSCFLLVLISHIFSSWFLAAVPFTYMLKGPTVEYLGPGDLHNPSYDHLEVTSAMKALADYRIRSSHYSGPEFDYDFCPTTFRIYPDKMLQDYYTSSDPLIFALSSVAIFIFTSSVFIIYDVCIERRQKLVMKKAKQSTAVVESLFPEEVANRIMEQAPATRKSDMRAANMRSSLPNSQHQSNGDLVQDTGDETRPYAGKPIANLYPNCTVFFADIAGFTKWSSSRTPECVFLLLEALYSSFDKHAKRRRVFKVETIGDCYLAVCGLPQPRNNHAVTMCRFAFDCLLSANRIVKELDNEHALERGTADLSLRVGLHSGPGKVWLGMESLD